MATVLLSAGAKGKRYALPNATVHMHQAMGGARGQASDIEIAAREILRNNEIIRNILAVQTGQTIERIRADTDRDFYLSAVPGARVRDDRRDPRAPRRERLAGNDERGGRGAGAMANSSKRARGSSTTARSAARTRTRSSG